MSSHPVQPSRQGGAAAIAPAAERSLCPQIEIDLSAMVDGELDPASVRRVLVHSEVCPSCRGFLDGIRTQMRAHRDLADAGLTAEGTDFEAPANPRAEALREQLVRNREQLGRILYEVGRGYVLMGMSPSFSRTSSVITKPESITWRRPSY